MNMQTNVLLADDDTDDCRFFELALNELTLNTELTIVHNGEQLMSYLTDESNKIPDVLFLDLNMPRKNGFECLLEIKLNKKIGNIPIIVYSTSLEQERVNELRENGAQYFIRKPNEFADFKKIIQKSLLLIEKKNITETPQENFLLT